jgi:hypothetical protein
MLHGDDVPPRIRAIPDQFNWTESRCQCTTPLLTASYCFILLSLRSGGTPVLCTVGVLSFFSSSYISRSSAHDMQFGSEQYGERSSLESSLKGRIGLLVTLSLLSNEVLSLAQETVPLPGCGGKLSQQKQPNKWSGIVCPMPNQGLLKASNSPAHCESA